MQPCEVLIGGIALVSEVVAPAAVGLQQQGELVSHVACLRVLAVVASW